MGLTLSSSPAQITSVNDDNNFVVTVTPDNVKYSITDGTPFGLAKINLIDSLGVAAPSVFVGQLLHITDTASIYYGTHVITEILTPVLSFSSRVVINTVFIGSASSAVNSAALFSNLNFLISEYPNLSIDGAVGVIARVKATVNNSNVINLKLSEYLKSYLINKKSISYGISIFAELGGNRHTVVNSILPTANITSLFTTDATIFETISTLVFFKGFKTFVSNSNKDDAILNVKREVLDIANYTQTSTAPTNILGTQTVEVFQGCFKDALNIVYLNFAGGLRNYVVFNDIAISREFENEIRFRNNDLAEFIQSVNHFEQYEVSCENVRMTHSETIDQMIASPLTWLADSAGNLTPIVINKESFLKYKSYDESLNFSFTFRKSETKQSQLN